MLHIFELGARGPWFEGMDVANHCLNMETRCGVDMDDPSANLLYVLLRAPSCIYCLA